MSEEKTTTAPTAPGSAGASPKAPAAPGENPAATAAAAAAAAKAPSPMLVLIGVTVAALIGGVVVGRFLVAPGVIQARAKTPAVAASHEPKDEKDEKGDGKEGKEHGGGKSHGKGKAKDRPPAYRMDNIIVNPAGSNGQRFLMASVAIEVDDARTAESMRERDVELRDVVISTIERQTLSDLTRLGGRDSLRAQIIDALQPIIGERPRVFLPQFVLQ